MQMTRGPVRCLVSVAPAWATLILASALADQPSREPPGAQASGPCVIGHRGLLQHAPENTLAGFSACLALRLGFEFDVRRSRDGQLVCLHDATVDRTTDGKGKLADLSLAELRKLDAGRWYASDFAGQRVPTLDEVFTLLREMKEPRLVVAVDLKLDDETAEADIVGLAAKHKVLDQLVFIGRAISEPSVRKKLRAANARTHAAALANTATELPEALKAPDADWVYTRFVPTPEQATRIHQEGKRVLVSGQTVMGHERDNWRLAKEAPVDALLTDYPLECRHLWRTAKEK